MRPWPLLLLALTACEANAVRSARPLFGPEDAAGPLVTRPGVWSQAEPGCRFDPAAPLKHWPDCANGDVAGRDDFNDADANSLLVAGDPMIVQYGYGKASDDDPLPYGYMALRPLARDARGRVTAFRAWTVKCGPPPPAPADPAVEGHKVTDHPLPGLTIAEPYCRADDKAAVRAAAQASEAWSPPITSRWERRARWWRGERQGPRHASH